MHENIYAGEKYELIIALIPNSFKTRANPKNIELFFETASNAKNWSLKIKLDFCIVSETNSAKFSKSFNLNGSNSSYAFGIVDTYKDLVKNNLILNDLLIFKFSILICGY